MMHIAFVSVQWHKYTHGLAKVASAQGGTIMVFLIYIKSYMHIHLQIYIQ